MRKADLQRLRTILEDRLVALYRSAHQRVRIDLLGERDTDEPLDEGDAALLSQQDGLASGLAEGEAARAQRIEEALARMKTGDFGRCLDCDVEIERERLEAVPWALRCAECQEAFEGAYHSPTL
jgi:DnaK suppressor protein